MPQMAPMNWLTLFIHFSVIFMIFNTMTFFLFNYEPLNKNIKMNKKSFNWKW